MKGVISNSEIGSVFNEKEKEILRKSGAWCHGQQMKRASNPHSLPESRHEWEAGWIAHQIEHRRMMARRRYLIKKETKARYEAIR